MAEKPTTGTKQGEPVAPGAGDLDREMDPTKRRREMPDGRGAPDMGGDIPRQEPATDKPTGPTPTR